MLSTLEAYERWAPRYPPLPHNPLMRAEQDAMRGLWPEVENRRALDLACGSGRYARLLCESRAALVVALDFCAPMLGQVTDGHRVRAGMLQLPFADDAFDAVICGLALGHVNDLEAWMSEVARVLRPGGTLLYSDFHPDASRAGHLRSFEDLEGRSWTVPHNRHEVACQAAAAVAAGLEILNLRELRAGIELCESFRGSDEFYCRWRGLPLVLIVRARK